jgi:hypothetical protein
MANVTITIPDDRLQRVLNKFAIAHGYQVNIPDPTTPGQRIPNPQTRAQFLKAQIIKFIQESVKSVEIAEKTAPVKLEASNAVDSEIVLT